MKKTKKQTGKLQGKIIKSQQLSFENSMTKNNNQEENEVEQNCNEENTPDDQKENTTVELIEERELGEEAQENTKFVCPEKKTVSQILQVPGEGSFDQEHMKEQVVDVLEVENEVLNETAAEELFAETVRCSVRGFFLLIDHTSMTFSFWLVILFYPHSIMF